jgi:ribosomal protein S18 acetylase RimI-like enzyme
MDAAKVHITHREDAGDLRSSDLSGFLEGWPHRPSPESLFDAIGGSDHVVLARSAEGRLVGFITAISDGVLSAYIPLMEVLPEFRGRGIGSELMRRMLARLAGLYMVDLCCDDDMVDFYRRFDMTRLNGMALRNGSAISDRST